MAGLIKAVVFDLDDTLYDCTGSLLEASRRRAARVLVEAGLPMSPEEALRMQVALGEERGPHFKVFDEIARQYDLGEEVIASAYRAYNSDEVGEIHLFSDASSTLKFLRDEGILCFLLTSGIHKRQAVKIHKLGLEDAFDEVVINDVERGQLISDCLRHLLGEYDLRPGETLLVGDRPPQEIHAGNDLGMLTVQMLHGRFKDQTPKSDIEEPDYKIQHIAELHNVLRVIHRRNKGAGGDPRVVAIGGGTGLPIVLQGLKGLTSNLTAVVTVTDAGRSSGRIRADFGLLPPGDMRNCLVALSDSSQLLNDLFQYRYPEGDLAGMSFGNLFIATMAMVTGSFEAAVRETSRILAIQGKVLPSTYEDVHLCAKLEDGRIVEGEVEVRAPGKAPIADVFLKPADVAANDEAITEILGADLIVIGPGSLYSSVIANLLVPAVPEAIRSSKARRVYVCNIVTQPGQTDGYTAGDHIDAIVRYLGEGALDGVLVNSNVPPEPVLARYREEGAGLVHLDDGVSRHRVQIILDDLVETLDHHRILWEKQDLLRHDPDKLAELISSLL